MVYVECLSLLIFLSNNTPTDDCELNMKYFARRSAKPFRALMHANRNLKETHSSLQSHSSIVYNLLFLISYEKYLHYQNQTKHELQSNQKNIRRTTNQTKHFAFFKSSVQPSITTQIKHQTVEQARSSKATSEAFLYSKRHRGNVEINF